MDVSTIFFEKSDWVVQLRSVLPEVVLPSYMLNENLPLNVRIRERKSIGTTRNIYPAFIS